MALIFISPKAVEDLDGIKDYIENRLKNPIVAKRAVLRIIDAYGVLADTRCSFRLKTARIR